MISESEKIYATVWNKGGSGEFIGYSLDKPREDSVCYVKLESIIEMIEEEANECGDAANELGASGMITYANNCSRKAEVLCFLANKLREKV